MKNIAAFDVGGTFIKYGVVDENGEILFKDKFKSPRQDCKNTVPYEIIEKIKELQKEYEIYAVGISTTGKVDSKNGEIVFASDNLPGYTGAKLSEEIKNKTGLNCIVENDVNAVALGELWKGAGKGRDTFICIALGTGIGGAIVINKKLYKGIGEGAGEIGHAVIERKGEKCQCGGEGCYERYGSTSALIRSYSKAANVDIESLSGEIIMNKITAGESLAISVYDEFLNSVVTGLANLTHILDPGLIIIGGGISSQGEPFFQEINRRFKNKVMPSYAEYTEIIQAQLENDAGIIGAAYSATHMASGKLQ